MPNITFPSSPSTNQIYTYGSSSWTYNGYAWILNGFTPGVSGTSGISGTSGYVSVFSSSSNIGIGTMYDTGSRVILGSTSDNGGGILQTAGNIVPTTTNTYNLGTPSLQWNNLSLSGTETVGSYIGVGQMSTPGGMSGTAGITGGSLTAGNYYYALVAVDIQGNTTTPGSQTGARNVASGTTGSVALSWGAVAGAASYRIYQGTTSGSLTQYLTTSGAVTTITDTGTGYTAGTPPTTNTAYNNYITNTVANSVNGITVGYGGGKITSNTAIGFNALIANTVGNGNVAIGTYALQSSNQSSHVAIGYAALVNLTGGANCVSIGNASGRFFGTAGTSNNISSTNSIFIGYNSFPLASANTNTIVIGANTVGNGSNTTTIGNSSITSTYLAGSTYSSAFNPTAAQTTVAGSVSGNAVFSTPFNGASYKYVIAYCNSLNGTAAYTISFTNTPVVTFASSGLSASTLTTSSLVVSGSSTTGYLILEGY